MQLQEEYDKRKKEITEHEIILSRLKGEALEAQELLKSYTFQKENLQRELESQKMRLETVQQQESSLQSKVRVGSQIYITSEKNRVISFYNICVNTTECFVMLCR